MRGAAGREASGRLDQVRSGLHDHLHGTFFASVEAIEPIGGVFEVGRSGDQWSDLDCTRGEQFDALRDFAVGGAGSVDRQFSGDDGLEGQFDAWSEVSDEGDRAASSYDLEARADGFVSSDDFHGCIGSALIGPI